MNLGTSLQNVSGLLPVQRMEGLGRGDTTLPGGRPEDYHEASADALDRSIDRAWVALSGRWSSYKAALDALPESDRGTSVTRARWLLPLFEALGYGGLRVERAALQADGRAFAISHRWGAVPIHLVGGRVSLDKRLAVGRGPAASAPHGLVNDFLTVSGAHRWAFVSNGKELRVLYDPRSLTRQAYVSFDLEAIFDGEQVSAFRRLYLICHASRVDTDRLGGCWLDTWVSLAQQDGVRALDRLRAGVEVALEALGRGFVTHPGSGALRARLTSGEMGADGLYQQLLRLVVRLLFLFVAEDRDLLLVPDAPEAAKARFRSLYATRRLRDQALDGHGDPHEDAWRTLRTLMTHLDVGNAELGLPALGSFLWRTETRGGACVGRAIADLDTARIANEDLYTALRALCVVQDGAVALPVDWAGVQADALGSLYEALMARVPTLDLSGPTFSLGVNRDNERRTTGSFYTSAALVNYVLESALDPVLERAARSVDPEKAILALSVVDPACGSGHFLVAAARRIARRLARVRSGGTEPSPPDLQDAVRDVLRCCIYGVDLNPTAVELCKVSLWMEAAEPGQPLAFLDRHIRLGNAILGATPELMDRGSPDAARTAVARARDPSETDDHAERMADLWCAAALGPKKGVDDPSVHSEHPALFHWHIAFPGVFRRGGFDAVVGNPPFLNQLESAVAHERRARLLVRWMYGGDVAPYTDVATLFLLRAQQILRPDGRQALVHPLSLVASAGAGPARARLANDGTLVAAWMTTEHIFAAAKVHVCVITVKKSVRADHVVERTFSNAFSPATTTTVSRSELVSSETWGDLLYDLVGTPVTHLKGGGRISDFATTTADFRDQFFDLAPFVHEETEGNTDDRAFPRLIVTGLVDPAVGLWGVRGCTFNKRTYLKPRIDLAALERDSALGPWARRRMAPKIIVATQSRVLEAFADAKGTMINTVPTITVLPKEAGDLWRLLAVILSPPISAWASRRFFGTALSPRAIKLSAEQVGRLPTPCRTELWDEAAAWVKDASETDDAGRRWALLEGAGGLMCDAYDVPRQPVMAWWRDRFPRRDPSVGAAAKPKKDGR